VEAKKVESNAINMANEKALSVRSRQGKRETVGMGGSPLHRKMQGSWHRANMPPARGNGK
jgi:hypothetical protein